MNDCPLCQPAGAELLWENAVLRVIDARDPQYPGFTRVIWKKHIAEMTDLTPSEQAVLMQVVLQVERIQRTILQPDKINLAAFGNMVPHLHWHIIPRWRDDAHFPQPVWASLPQADQDVQALHENRRLAIASKIPTYHTTLRNSLTT